MSSATKPWVFLVIATLFAFAAVGTWRFVAGPANAIPELWMAANDHAKIFTGVAATALESFHRDLGRYPTAEEGFDALFLHTPCARP